MAFAPPLTFWVMSFQDILRMNVELSRDVVIRRMLERHQAEDAGHEEWFLEDLKTIYGEDTGSIRSLFAEDSQGVRAAAYRLTSEVFRVSDDRLRLIIVEVLEAAAGIFFNRIARFLAETGHAGRLRYFAGEHLTAEAGHELHAQDQKRELDSIQIPPELRPEADALIKRMVAAFWELGDALAARVDAARAGRDLGGRRTFRSFAEAKLRALSAAVKMESSLPPAMDLLDHFMFGWGNREISGRPTWRSNITDDHTPFELSLAIEEGRPELRFLIEVQGYPMSTLESTWDAARAMNQHLVRDYGCSLEQLKRVEDLFVPNDPAASFSMWHAICLRQGEPPDIKIYVNPRVRGPANAMGLVAEAFQRNGYQGAVYFVTDRVLRGPRDNIVYFSLDLVSGNASRIKVYAAHPGITASDFEAHLSLCGSDLRAGEASAFCRAMTGSDGPYDGKPLLACYAFTDPKSELPSEVTLHVPIRAYVDHDEEAVERVQRFLQPEETRLWRSAIDALAQRSLDSGRGLMQWVSIKRRRGKRRVTFYLAPEAYEPLAPRSPADRGARG